MQIRTVVTALGLAVAVGALGAPQRVEAAMKATVGPIKFRANLKTVATLGTNTSGFIVTGNARKKFTLTQLTLVCGTGGSIVAGTTYACSGAILQGGPTGNPRGWTTDTGIMVTVTRYKGRKIVGTFSGTMENVGDTNPPGDGPAGVSGGKFAAKIVG